MNLQPVVLRGSTRKCQMLASTVGANPKLSVGNPTRLTPNSRRTSLIFMMNGSFQLQKENFNAIVNTYNLTGDIFYRMDINEYGPFVWEEIIVIPSTAMIIWETFIEGDLPQ